MISADEAPIPIAPTITARSERRSASRAASAASASSATRKRLKTSWIVSVYRFPSSATNGSRPISGSSFTTATSGVTKSRYSRILSSTCWARLRCTGSSATSDCKAARRAGSALMACVYGSRKTLSPVNVRPRRPVSMSTTSFSSRNEAAVTSAERASRAVASRWAVTAKISAAKAATTRSASVTLASHIRRASVTRAAPRRHRSARPGRTASRRSGRRLRPAHRARRGSRL